MLSRTGYDDRWGYDWGFYGPTVRMAVKRGAQVLALNTERELTKRVSRNGVGALTDAERANMPELKLDDPVHRAWWAAIMGGMSHPEEEKSAEPADPHAEPPTDPAAKPANDPAQSSEDQVSPHGESPMAKPLKDRGEWIYSAQVLWDETMADGAAKWLAEDKNRQIIILAGNGHCHDSGIVARIKRRGFPATISVQPVIDSGDGGLAAELASPENDFLFVMTFPKK